MNADALEAFVRLRERAEAFGGGLPEHYVFPACERDAIAFSQPQKSIRTAWRNLTKAVGLKGFRFHDLRHQAITEMAESGAADATMMSLAGHLSKRMLEHYSHARMLAKRNVVDGLNSGLIERMPDASEATGKPC